MPSQQLFSLLRKWVKLLYKLPPQVTEQNYNLPRGRPYCSGPLVANWPRLSCQCRSQFNWRPSDKQLSILSRLPELHNAASQNWTDPPGHSWLTAIFGTLTFYRQNPNCRAKHLVALWTYLISRFFWCPLWGTSQSTAVNLQTLERLIKYLGVIFFFLASWTGFTFPGPTLNTFRGYALRLLDE